MKFLYIPIIVVLFSCNNNTSKRVQSREDSLVESANLKIKILKERGDSIEKANVKRTDDH